MPLFTEHLSICQRMESDVIEMPETENLFNFRCSVETSLSAASAGAPGCCGNVETAEIRNPANAYLIMLKSVCVVNINHEIL